MFNIIVIISMIYLILVLKIYSISLYYMEFNGVRKYSLLAPLITVRLFTYAIFKKEYSVINCFVFHLPTTFKIIGIQYCLLNKVQVNKKRKKTVSLKQKNKSDMKILLEKTEKLICQY